MKSLEEKAKTVAEAYVGYALGTNPSPEEAFTAKEDYASGYIAGATIMDLKMQSLRQCLEDLLHIAENKREKHSLAYVKHLLEAWKV